MVFLCLAKNAVLTLYLAPSKDDDCYVYIYSCCRFECRGSNSESL